ncbi:MAG: tRNA (guanosine(37)-N1)-methyltransferase TrmD [Phycisphaeraceae bacterium]|nr:tRNA (guanosine(37)-N1)-methyltransferase TrmD [Phycisphaeraceae bacterium]
MRIDVLTTFPEMFAAEPPAALGVSIPARARAAGIVEVVATDIRAYAENKHAKTDDRPFGGGPGMVMMCQPIWDAVRGVEASDPRPAHRVLLTPQGRPLTQAMVERLAGLPRLLVLAGHYEGIDERVIEALAPEEISIGDYVLSGGELAAMVLIDAVVRLLPGALGDQESALAESFSTVAGAGDSPHARLLDCPHFTRPRVWQGREAPEILVSGDHAKVARWRLEQRLARTRDRRPDLLPNDPQPDPQPDPQANPAEPACQPPGRVDSPGTGS